MMDHVLQSWNTRGQTMTWLLLWPTDASIVFHYPKAQHKEILRAWKETEI